MHSHIHVIRSTSHPALLQSQPIVFQKGASSYHSLLDPFPTLPFIPSLQQPTSITYKSAATGSHSTMFATSHPTSSSPFPGEWSSLSRSSWLLIENSLNLCKLHLVLRTKKGIFVLLFTFCLTSHNPVAWCSIPAWNGLSLIQTHKSGWSSRVVESSLDPIYCDYALVIPCYSLNWFILHNCKHF